MEVVYENANEMQKIFYMQECLFFVFLDMRMQIENETINTKLK